MGSQTNRKDHYLPQSYLRGFIDPSRANHRQPLWHFDVHTKVWTERSPREVGYRRGFYDYATAAVGLETADSTFAELERDYPLVRQQLISGNFKRWKEYRDFLLCYAQMMRARSLLFFENMQADGKNLRMWTIKEVSPDRRSVKLHSMIPTRPPDAFIRNWTIAKMREEIEKGPAWLNDFNWALRFCESPADPFIISETPFVAQGSCSALEEALRHPETLLFFPLCWQACLIGSRRFFEIETGGFASEDMHRTRQIYCEAANLFVLSPTRLDW